LIIVEDRHSIGEAQVVEVKVGQDIRDMLEGFHTFIGGIDFSFTGTACFDRLAATIPVKGTMKPQEKTGERTSSKEGKLR
jgi:hypothetical protein